jgi:hypothetical protein
MSICPICKTKLIPIVYGRLNPDLIDKQKEGLLVIGGNKDKKVKSYCPLCEEAYEAVTDTP